MAQVANYSATIKNMNNAIVLHGKPSKEEYYNPEVPSCSNFHWFPWLQKQLLVHDIHAHTPEIPDAWKPYYPTWQKEFERFDITPDTILVGHSCGGGFLVRWLSEHKDIKVGKVILVAPSLGVGWDDTNFFDFEIDPELASRTKGLTIFGSDNDKPSLIEAAANLRSTIKGSQFKEFKGYGHFTLGSMGTDKFPELLEALLASSGPSSRNL